MNKQTPTLTAAQVFEQLKSRPPSAQRSYLAMYSSWLGGIVTDPELMMLPLDDHLVHRGDGVFEAMKILNGGIYLLDEHMDRLFVSAQRLDLGAQFKKDELVDIIKQTVQAAFAKAKVQNSNLKPEDFGGMIRIFLSRGPGSFSTSPYDNLGNQFYCVVTENKSLAADKYSQGVVVGKSRIPVKQSFYPTVKSCNYIPNVLMKKESLDRKLDFTIALTESGSLAESSTENIFILDKNFQLVHPRLEYILKGTTMTRLFELVAQNHIVPVSKASDISEADLISSRGVFIAGTTLDVIAVDQYEGMKLPRSEIYPKLRALIAQDQQMGSKKLIPWS